MDHLQKLVAAVCPDSDIAKYFNCSRTTGAALIKNVIGGNERELLKEKLKCNKFSVMADESTDVGCIKNLSLVARTVNETFTVSDEFLTLIPVEGTKSEQFYK